jgi:predicted DNA binding CopG/RHH family protein
MKSSKKATKKKNKLDDPLSSDLSPLFSQDGWKRVKFEFKPKNKTLTIRVSDELLDAVKERAKEAGMEYQRWVRMALEHLVDKKAS